MPLILCFINYRYNLSELNTGNDDRDNVNEFWRDRTPLSYTFFNTLNFVHRPSVHSTSDSGMTTISATECVMMPICVIPLRIVLCECIEGSFEINEA